MAAAPAQPQVIATACPGCQAVGSVSLRVGETTTTCRSCRSIVEGTFFPALRPKSEPPSLPTAPSTEGTTPCFYNPARQATTSCGQCGVFISAAWAAKWGSRTLCLRCLEKLRQEKRGSEFESSRWLWDNICLLLAGLPVLSLFPWIAVVTAPTAVILAVRGWSKPGSLVPRSRLRLVIAGLLALAQVGLLVLGVYYFFALLINPPA